MVNSPDPRATCPYCDVTTHPIPYGTPYCHYDHVIGSVNVRRAKHADESDSLDKRFVSALEECADSSTVNRFIEVIQENSAVCFNVNYNTLKQIFQLDEFYRNYTEQVEAGTRPKTDEDKDRQRRMADEYIYPGYGQFLRHGALYLGGRGTANYGPFALIIRDKNILENFCSTLEENSYHFFNRHLTTTDIGSVFPIENPPNGYRSDWQNCHKIAVVKFADILKTSPSEDDFPAMLIDSQSDRGGDEFIEVAVYRDEKTKAAAIDKSKISEICFDGKDEENYEKVALIEEYIDNCGVRLEIT
jgi:hypothetical protein